MPITSVSECKAFRDIPSDNTEHDGELERLILAAQDFIERKCSRQFDQGTVTEYYNGSDTGHGRDVLRVARPPIVSITNIWDDTERAYATALLSTSYVIDDAKAGIIRLDRSTFQSGLRNIKITYVGGFSVFPRDLAKKIIEMVWAGRAMGHDNLVGVRSRSIADGNVQYLDLAWESMARDIVNDYSLHVGVA